MWKKAVVHILRYSAGIFLAGLKKPQEKPLYIRCLGRYLNCFNLKIQVGKFITSTNFSSNHSAENVYFKFCCRKYCVIYLGGNKKFYRIFPGKHKEKRPFRKPTFNGDR
jgi:hypothetical protein